MKALILAAGYGTRLAPHTHFLPKPLFPVAGKPVLGRLIATLKHAGCHGIAVNTHHLADQISDYLSRNDFGLPVVVSHETEIMGTGGAIRRLVDYWDSEPFIVINADIVTDIDLARAYRDHRRRAAPVTLVMHDREPFNQVWVDSSNKVIGFDRFRVLPDTGRHRKIAFTGIHVVDAGIVRWIPPDEFCDIISVYQRILDEGGIIHAHVATDHYWQDMGSPHHYRDVVVDVMAPKAFRSAFPGRTPAAIQRLPLSGDGSDRDWYRLTDGRHSLVLVDHGITTSLPGSEVNAFVAIGNHLYECGIPVPRIQAHDRFSGLVFLDDLGDCHLQQIVYRADSDTWIEKRYRSVIDTMLDLTVHAADGFDPAWTCQSPCYDVPLILDKECRYFVDAFLNGYLEMAVDYAALAAEFERLAHCALDSGVTGLIHRDFQSRNIMVHDHRIYLIDFQGARRGPVQYDLAALLIDPYVRLNPDLQRRLLIYAAGQAARRLHCTPDRFVRGFRYCSVTRNLQILGAFGFLSRIKKKKAFERWIPTAASMLANHLRQAGGQQFPQLSTIAESIGKS